MNNSPFAQSPPSQSLSFGPIDILNMRIGLDSIKNPSPPIREAIQHLDRIINSFVLGLVPGQPTLSNSPDFPSQTN